MTNFNKTVDRPLDCTPQVQASSSAVVSDDRFGIYMASKVKHAEKWIQLRAQGYPIISTWIDEAGVGQSSDLSDLWRRCIHEASTARFLILYREPEDVLKGGWVELGAALASGVTVYAVGIGEYTVAHDKRITHFATLDAALAALTTSKDIPLTLRPFHIELLKRGTDGRDIWVHARAELFGAEMAALAEMKRAGLVEQSPKSSIPGPPDVPAYVLTDAGRAALSTTSKEPK